VIVDIALQATDDTDDGDNQENTIDLQACPVKVSRLGFYCEVKIGDSQGCFRQHLVVCHPEAMSTMKPTDAGRCIAN